MLGIGAAVGEGLAGLLCHYTKHIRLLLIFSTTTLTVFAAAMISVGNGERGKAIGFMSTGSLALGVIEGISLSLAPLTLPPEDLGLAIGALGTIRSAGGAIGGISPGPYKDDF